MIVQSLSVRVDRWVITTNADLFHFYESLPGPALCGREPIAFGERCYEWRGEHGPARTDRCRECSQKARPS